jgi:superfamily I DNA/RNA helicase/mRNA-degrading endonuclease RelE of RelBE toxin-antitoxin system
MPWQTLHKPAYDTDFIELNKDTQRAVIRSIHDLELDPITPRGNTIKPMRGYKNLWRYRLGDVRLIYAVAPAVELIQLLAVGQRKDIYQRFDYDGWDAPDAAAEFGPELAAAAPPEWLAHPEWLAPQKRPLERRMTPELLAKWRIPAAYHGLLAACAHEEDVEALFDALPGEVMGRVMEALYPATVAQIAAQPDQVLFAPEDLARYADGDLNGFLLYLDEQQRPLAGWALEGPTLVKGGPGSGKSTVALYRVRALIEEALAAGEPLPAIMFTTYTNSLISSSKSLLGQLLSEPLGLAPGQKLPPQVRVTTLHKTAVWIVRRRGQAFAIAGEAQRAAALRAARAALQPRGLGDAAKIPTAALLSRLRDEYLLAEFEWVIAGQDCRTLEDYLAAERAGRGIPFPAATRTAVWRLFEAYHDDLLRQELYTWGYVLQLALQQVRSGEFARRWDYVLVDEAQDLPPVALALCVELCKRPEGLFLTADANQSLYNRGFRWAHVHEQLKVTGRSRILRRNYRSTRQIALAAGEIMSAGGDLDDEVLAQEYVHNGPPPLRYGAAGGDDQAAWIAAQVTAAARQLRLPPHAAVVLVPSSAVGRPLAAALSARGLPAKFMSSSEFSLDEPAVKVTTLHAAKGLEFPIVVVAHVEAGRLPREQELSDTDERAAFLHEQRRLFYVGCTRAMRRLFVTYDRALPSPFLDGLSAERWETGRRTQPAR